MKYFEMSVMIAVMLIPVIVAAVCLTACYGLDWGLAPLALLGGALGVALYITFTAELADYRKARLSVSK